MDRKRVALITFSLLCLLFGSIHPYQSFAQNNRERIVKRVINEKGWEIPGLSQSKITDARRPLSERYGGSSEPLYITVLKPRREFVTTISLYGIKEDQETLTVSQSQVQVQAIIKCEMNKHVFAYVVQFITVLYDPETRRGGYGGILGIQYYDNDGDGKFESYEPNDPFITLAFRIPDWILKQ